jgi:glutamyl-tRNA synthetase
MDKPRLRFAPSPTGSLHIGGARTALFNWLWAKKTGGTFVLRIEDTDVARNTRESVEAIFDALGWLGLDWDEGPAHADDDGGGPNGPYFQSKRLAIYREFAERLVRSGHAYRCYCTPEEEEAARQAVPEDKRKGWTFVSPWRDKREELDKPYAIKLKAYQPDSRETVQWKDLVMGTIKIPASSLRDEVLIRSNNPMPLYNFGCVVDDLTMGITHVIRGKDHVINTPTQILLYRALDAALPTFGHLPMLMKDEHQKLSKRDGAVGVDQYRAQGYLPEGLLSYLVRFGWSFGNEELFTRAKLVELFDWSRVSKADGIYDFKKCKAINQKFIAKVAPVDDLCRRVVPFLAQRGLLVREGHPRLPDAVTTVKHRCDTLVAMADEMDFFFRAKPVMDEQAAAQLFKPEFADALDALARFAEEHVPERDQRSQPFAEAKAALDEALRGKLAELGQDMKVIGQPVRLALSGRTATPDLSSMMLVLGPAVTALRLREGAARSRATPPGEDATS